MQLQHVTETQNYIIQVFMFQWNPCIEKLVDMNHSISSYYFSNMEQLAKNLLFNGAIHCLTSDIWPG